ncbi:MAG TPA: hypothetical protein VFV99_23530 [Kofleriaceae bacterium]|nr:hypothetical protein [Kofleriaceae bacterium]
MRWSLLLLLVALPRLAFAEPKVAVAPLDDDDGKVAEIVSDAVAERAKLTKPARVESAMKSLGVSVLSPKSLKKLRTKLDVDVVIYGSVERDGDTKRVSLTFAGSNKSKPKLELEAKNTKQLRKELAGKLAKRIDSAMEGGGGDDDEEEEDDARAKREQAKREEERKQREEEDRKKEEEKRKKEEEEAEAKRKKEDERRKKDDDEREARRKKKDDDEREARRKKRGDDDEEDGRRRKKRGDDDEEDGRRKKRVADEDDEDSGRARKRLGDEDEDSGDDEDKPRRKKRKQKRHVLTQAALWLDGGGAVARRTLTYAATGMMRPPPVGTAAAAGRIEGEVYPASFSSLKGGAAGFGISAILGYTFGLGIAVPGTQKTAAIKNGHYSIGARYRFVFGEHSVALGVSYWRRYFMADRTGLMNPDQLDMPDVDYTAIAPGVSARIAATPTIAAFGSLDLPLMLDSGPIQKPASYGSAKILAFDLRAGAQVMVASNIALQFAAEIDQIGLSFTGQAGSKASTRMVTAATDRSIGLAATLGVTY